MSQRDKDFDQRRKVITLLGTGAVALPILGLAGCGGDKSADKSDAMGKAGASMEEAAKEAEAEIEEAAETAMEEVEDALDSAEDSMSDAIETAEAEAETLVEEAQTIATDAADDMAEAVRVDENGPQAMGVGYRHDATSIDAASQPRYAAGQQCSNCALYQGGDAAWGGCPLFAGQQVKATGWCSAYASAG